MKSVRSEEMKRSALRGRLHANCSTPRDSSLRFSPLFPFFLLPFSFIFSFTFCHSFSASFIHLPSLELPGIHSFSAIRSSSCKFRLFFPLGAQITDRPRRAWPTIGVHCRFAIFVHEAGIECSMKGLSETRYFVVDSEPVPGSCPLRQLHPPLSHPQ